MGFFTTLMLKNYRNCVRKVIADFKYNFANTEENLEESYRIFEAMINTLKIKDDNPLLYYDIKDICRSYTGAVYFICSAILTDNRTMKIRVAQLFGIIDYEMIQSGFKPCSLEEKKRLYKFFDVLDIYELNPELFNFHF